MTGSVVGVDEVNAYLAEQGPFTRPHAIRIESLGAGEAVAKWTYDPKSVRPGGYVSGPTLFGIADLVGWVLCFTTEGITPMAVTWDLHITFLRPATDGNVIARGRQRKRGRSLIYGEVDLFIEGQDDKPVAHATFTYALPKQEVPGTY